MYDDSEEGKVGIDKSTTYKYTNACLMMIRRVIRTAIRNIHKQVKTIKKYTNQNNNAGKVQ